MLFAEEGFWKPPNVYDAIGVVGLVLALLGIWLSWRDIRRRVAEAKREAIRLIADSRLQLDLTDLQSMLGRAREAVRVRDWTRTVYELDATERLFSRVQQHPRLSAAELEVVQRASESVGVIADEVENRRRKCRTSDLPGEQFQLLGQAISAVATVAAAHGRRMTGEQDS